MDEAGDHLVSAKLPFVVDAVLKDQISQEID